VFQNVQPQFLPRSFKFIQNIKEAREHSDAAKIKDHDVHSSRFPRAMFRLTTNQIEYIVVEMLLGLKSWDHQTCQHPEQRIEAMPQPD
jgi:hypothetical protein